MTSLSDSPENFSERLHRKTVRQKNWGYKMDLSLNSFQIVALLILGFCIAAAQTPSDAKHFSKDGLLFDYPSEWIVADTSSSDAQELTLTHANTDAQLRVFVHRGHISAEKLADARKALVDPYIESTSKQFEQMGGQPTRSADSTEIGGVKADGVKIRAVLGGEPGAAQIFWVLAGKRVVVLTFFGPDKDLKQWTSAWDLIRGSLKIEEIKPAPKPTPK